MEPRERLWGREGPHVIGPLQNWGLQRACLSPGDGAIHRSDLAGRCWILIELKKVGKAGSMARGIWKLCAATGGPQALELESQLHRKRK